jgi:imidazolonepropionase-like amidohydrolase
MLRAKHIYLVPTNGALDVSLATVRPPFTDSSNPEEEATVRKFEARKIDSLRDAIELGVPIAAGSDDYIQIRGRTRGQVSLTWVEAYRDAGMKPRQIIESMTSSAAELLGWSDKVGSLEPGKFADIVAVQSNPLMDITTVEKAQFVMKGGVVIKDEIVKASHRK